MSGQHFEDSLHEIVSFFYEIVESEISTVQLARGRNEGFVRLFRESGYPSWISIYDDPPHDNSEAVFKYLQTCKLFG